MKKGDRVYVKKVPSKYPELSEGDCGIVASSYTGYGQIAVQFDNHYNGHSGSGLYYFGEYQLSTQKEETTMDGSYRVARIQFLEGANTSKSYAYACYDDSLVVGDICVVRSAHHGFGLGKIVGFITAPAEPIIREIVCKADFSAYEARIKARERRDELRKKMAERAAKMQEVALYKMLAAEDPEMAAMLSEYSELNHGN